MIVQTIPHYRIAEKLGEGGMGLPVRDVSRTFDITNEQPRPLSYETLASGHA